MTILYTYPFICTHVRVHWCGGQPCSARFVMLPIAVCIVTLVWPTFLINNADMLHYILLFIFSFLLFFIFISLFLFYFLFYIEVQKSDVPQYHISIRTWCTSHVLKFHLVGQHGDICQLGHQYRYTVVGQVHLNIVHVFQKIAPQNGHGRMCSRICISTVIWFSAEFGAGDGVVQPK